MPSLGAHCPRFDQARRLLHRSCPVTHGRPPSSARGNRRASRSSRRPCLELAARRGTGRGTRQGPRRSTTLERKMATCPKLIVPLQIDLARGDRRSLFRRTADPSACESAFKDAGARAIRRRRRMPHRPGVRYAAASRATVRRRSRRSSRQPGRGRRAERRSTRWALATVGRGRGSRPRQDRMLGTTGSTESGATSRLRLRRRGRVPRRG